MKYYASVNNMGEVGTAGVSYEKAKADAEYLAELYPDEEWEVIEEDDYSEED